MVNSLYVHIARNDLASLQATIRFASPSELQALLREHDSPWFQPLDFAIWRGQKELVAALVDAGTKLNASHDGVTALDQATTYFLSDPSSQRRAVIDALGPTARYGIGWEIGYYDVLSHRDAPEPSLMAASARVLAFAQCGRQHDPTAWEAVANHAGAPALAQALNGFASVREYEDPIPFRNAMRMAAGNGWIEQRTTEGNTILGYVPGLANVVLRLQQAPGALDRILKMVEPSQPGACGNQPAQHAFMALNAMPLCEALATADPDLRQAVAMARPVAVAHWLIQSVAARRRQINQESKSGPVVGDGNAAEYVNRVGAAVMEHLSVQLRPQLFGLLPEEAMVPLGKVVDTACARDDHRTFVANLARECTDALNGERPDIVHKVLCTVPDVAAIWQEALLDWVDRIDLLNAQKNPVRELLKSAARTTVSHDCEVSEGLDEVHVWRNGERVAADSKTFKDVTDGAKFAYENRRAQLCDGLTWALLDGPLSGPTEPGSDPRARVGPILAVIAAQYGLVELAQPLADAGVDLSAPDTDGWPLAAIAALEGHADFIRALHRLGVDVGVPLSQGPDIGRPPTVIAAVEGHANAIRALGEAGVDLGAVDTNGWTATAHAAATGNGEVIAALHERNVDVTASLTQGKLKGKTPIDLAIAQGHTAIAKLLENIAAASRNSAAPRIASPPSPRSCSAWTC